MRPIFITLLCALCAAVPLLRAAMAIPTLLAVLLLAPLTAIHDASDFQVSDMKTDYRQNPLGLETRHLRFFWRVSTGEQTAWQVQATSSPQRLAAGQADLWDSGKRAGAATAQIAYEGKPLSSRQRVWWRVRAWGKDGNASPWSEPAFFEMGLLNDADWRGAHWIGCSSRPSRRNRSALSRSAV